MLYLPISQLWRPPSPLDSCRSAAEDAIGMHLALPAALDAPEGRWRLHPSEACTWGAPAAGPSGLTRMLGHEGHIPGPCAGLAHVQAHLALCLSADEHLGMQLAQIMSHAPAAAQRPQWAPVVKQEPRSAGNSPAKPPGAGCNKSVYQDKHLHLSHTVKPAFCHCSCNHCLAWV